MSILNPELSKYRFVVDSKSLHHNELALVPELGLIVDCCAIRHYLSCVLFCFCSQFDGT